jgi:hypothetical protein
MVFFSAYLILLMSLPLLAQWRAGWRGNAVATVLALAFVVALYLYAQTALEPAPADWNPEARAEREIGGRFAILLLLLHLPAAAILTGTTLAAIWALIRRGIGARRSGASGGPGRGAPASKQTGIGVGPGANLVRILLLAGLAAAMIEAGFHWGLDFMYGVTIAVAKFIAGLYRYL